MQVNYLAVLAAALSSFLLGGLWYSRLMFGAAWQHAAGNPPKHGHPAKVFGLSLVFALVAAVAYALLIPVPASVPGAAVQGLLVGAGFVAASFGINYQFANRSTIMWLVDGGYHTLQFGLYGLILGSWQ